MNQHVQHTEPKTVLSNGVLNAQCGTMSRLQTSQVKDEGRASKEWPLQEAQHSDMYRHINMIKCHCEALPSMTAGSTLSTCP